MEIRQLVVEGQCNIVTSIRPRTASHVRIAITLLLVNAILYKFEPFRPVHTLVEYVLKGVAQMTFEEHVVDRVAEARLSPFLIKELGCAPGKVDDVVQDTVEYMLRFSKSRRILPVPQFIRQKAKYFYFDFRRRQGFEARLFCSSNDDHHPAPFDDPIVRDECCEQIRRVVERLPVKYKSVVKLCDLEEMTPIEASALLNIPFNTVKTRLKRARQKMKTLLSSNSQT